MKQELSSLELHYLVQELQVLDGAKIDQIYQPSKEELLLIFHSPSRGKAMLYIAPGKWLYLTHHKQHMPERPHGYCLYLRKHLRNARVVEIRQIDNERIVDIHLSTKDNKYHLFIELFMKGNVILTDIDGTILSPLETQEWKERSIKKGVKYAYPKHEYNALIMNKTPFIYLMKATEKESLVKALATDLGLGGTYAEELCLNAAIDKNKKPATLTEKESTALYLELVAMRDRKAKPCIVKEAGEVGKAGHVKDITPFPLALHKNFTQVVKETYSAALDEVLGTAIMQQKQESATKETRQQQTKVQTVIDMQSKQLRKLEEEAADCQKKGEAIYEQYQVVKMFLDEVKKEQKGLSGQELKALLESHHLVKKVDMKTKKVVIDV